MIKTQLHDSTVEFAAVERSLVARWPESRLEPSLDRINRLMLELGSPQHQFDVVHLTGTNGKTSTARMVDALLRTSGARTGRFTSPHLEHLTERVTIDGVALDPVEFVRAHAALLPAIHLVEQVQPHPLSFFEAMVGLAYLSFTRAAVDVAVVEVGMGGTWDATNVARGNVAVVTPIGIDHAEYLGRTIAAIASEKSGIIKEGASAIIAKQPEEAAAIIRSRGRAVGASIAWEGRDFGVVRSTPTWGGQVVSLQGLHGRFNDIVLPLHGPHQAQNAVVAIAAVESYHGAALDEDAVRTAFRGVSSPGRLEVVARNPTIILDAAHNPHGATATAAALVQAFGFTRVIGVVGVMTDKDAAGVLEIMEPHLDHVVTTQAGSSRAMPATDLGAVAERAFGAKRVSVAPRLDDALRLAVEHVARSDRAGDAAVLVIGSVLLAGEARALLYSPRWLHGQSPVPHDRSVRLARLI